MLEYANEGDLAHFMANNNGPLSLPLLKGLAKDILRGLAYLNTRGFVHRDIKPQNILLKREKRRVTAVLSGKEQPVPDTGCMCSRMHHPPPPQLLTNTTSRTDFGLSRKVAPQMTVQLGTPGCIL